MEADHQSQWEMKLEEVTRAAREWEDRSKELEAARDRSLSKQKEAMELRHARALEEQLALVQSLKKRSLKQSQTSKTTAIAELKKDFGTKLKKLKDMHLININEMRSAAEILFAKKIKSIREEYRCVVFLCLLPSSSFVVGFVVGFVVAVCSGSG